MKKYILILSLCVFVFAPFLGFTQQKKNSGKTKSWPMEEKHISMDSFPTNMMVNHLEGWGGMTVAVNSMPAGIDFTPMLMGLKNNSCQVPHWGYIIKGSLRLQYDDGKEVVLKAGDLFYMAPGHKAKAEEDLKLLDFSPQDEFKELLVHLEKKAAEQKK
ncbi:MAG TPA: cupin domain-containing protein [Chryseolinea sp.]|nr:cupin domain-containing protein [Chryseolinea sp.]